MRRDLDAPTQEQVFYREFNRDLTRITGSEESDSILDMLNMNPSASNSSSVTIPGDSLGAGTDPSLNINSAGKIQPATSSGSGLETSAIPGDNLQQKLDAVNAAGGGKLFLGAGTYAITTALTGYSNVEIIGEDETTTTLDFGSTSSNLTYAGTGVYSTGTITAASNVSITGSGTSWLANVTAGQNLFIGTRWYLIAAVTSNTTLILAEAYGDNVTLPSSYRIATVITGVVLKDLTIKSSTGTSVSFTDAKDIEFDRLTFFSNNVGLALTNVSRCLITQLVAVSSTSDGIQMTNCGLFNVSACQSAGNGGHGVKLNNVKTIPFLFSSSTSNTSDGYNCTTVVDTVFKTEASSNGGNGIQFVSGCSNCFVNDALCRGNTGDGVKLTASTSNCTLGSSLMLVSNGGWGINIADSTDSNNTIVVPYFSSNGSGTYQDNGTNTNVVASTSTPFVLQKTFTAEEAISSGDAVAVGSGSGTYTYDNQTSQNTSVAIDNGSVARFGQTFITPSDVTNIVSVAFHLTWGNATFTRNTRADIFATSGGLPTGASLGNATDSTAIGSAGSGVITYTFGSPIAVSASTTYCATIYDSGSGTNAVSVDYQNTDVFANGNKVSSSNSGSTWTANATNDMYYVDVMTRNDAGKIIQTSANASYAARYNSFVGFATSAIASGATGTVTLEGIFAHGSLTAGSTYFLSNTLGAIATSAGANSRKIGLALDTTNILIKQDNP